MTNAPNVLATLVFFFMPGFITSFLFYSLTSPPKITELINVLVTLFNTTIIIHIIVELLGEGLILAGNLFVIGEWDQFSRTVCTIIAAIFGGLLWSHLRNNDTVHKILRKILRKGQITNKVFYPDEWPALLPGPKGFVVLHLKNRRRIMGWPAEWPGDPGKKHFIMENARWLIFDRKGKTVALPFETEKVVIRAKNVKMLEFVSHRTALGGKHDEW